MTTSYMLFFRNAVTDLTTVVKNNAQQQMQMVTALRQDISKLIQFVENGLEHKYVDGSDIKTPDRKKKNTMQTLNKYFMSCSTTSGFTYVPT